MGAASDRLLKLRPVSFRYKGEPERAGAVRVDRGGGREGDAGARRPVGLRRARFGLVPRAARDAPERDPEGTKGHRRSREAAGRARGAASRAIGRVARCHAFQRRFHERHENPTRGSLDPGRRVGHCDRAGDPGLSGRQYGTGRAVLLGRRRSRAPRARRPRPRGGRLRFRAPRPLYRGQAVPDRGHAQRGLPVGLRPAFDGGERLARLHPGGPVRRSRRRPRRSR